MLLTHNDQLEGIQQYLNMMDIQVPLPTQAIHSLVEISNPSFGKSSRTHCITQASSEDFSRLTHTEEKHLNATPLWLWGIKIAPRLLLRVPIWRGEQPFKDTPECDDSVLAIVKRCFIAGGLNTQRMNQWIASQMQEDL